MKNIKTLLFGLLMGLFGAFAIFLSNTLGFPGWVLFIAWVSYYQFGKSLKKSANVFLQIVLGILIAMLIHTITHMLIPKIGTIGLYLAIVLCMTLLAFMTKIKGLSDLTAWFLGMIAFFGVAPEILPLQIIQKLLLPLALGFILGYVLDSVVSKYTITKH